MNRRDMLAAGLLGSIAPSAEGEVQSDAQIVREALLRIDATLDDAENHLAGSARLFTAFGGPAHGTFDGSAKFARRAGMRRAIVEDHGDIGAEFALDLHRFFRAEKKERAIEVGTEFDPVRFDLANGREAENLETAAISEDWERPIDEIVQATCRANDVHPGTNI